MKFVIRAALPLLLSIGAFGQCGRIAFNPITGLQDCIGTSGSGTGDLLSTNNLSDVASASTSRTNLGLTIGTNVVGFNGALGTPTSGTGTNITGLPIGTGVSGLGTGVATFLGTPSSANLAAAITNETGTGAVVFADSPTLTGTALFSTLNGSTVFSGNVFVSAGGSVAGQYFEDTSRNKGYWDTGISGFNWLNDNRVTGNVNAAFRAVTSQTADLTQWLAAGGTTTVAKMSVAGALTITALTNSSTGWTNANHAHVAANSGGQLAEGALSLTDITTNNATTSLHGFLPKLGGGTTNFFRADGTWAAPAGGGTVTVVSSGNLTSTALVTGGGSQALQTVAATATLDSSGNISTPGGFSGGVGGSVGGYLAFGQGTATTAPTTSVGFQAPATVTTKFMMTLPAAPTTGFLLNTGTTDPSAISFVAASGTGSVCLTTSCSMTTPAIGAATGASVVLSGALTSNALTSGRVTFAGTSGILQDDADMTFSTDTFTATKIAATTSLTVAGAAITNNVVQNSQSAAYTTVLGDAGKHVYHPVGDNNARTFTIDSNANVAYPVGTMLTFVNEINTVTIAITSDTMLLAGTATTGSRTLAAGGIATAIKVTSTRWIINGTGLS